MTNKKILFISLAVTIIHFVLTSIIFHYISLQVGSQTGQVVASGITDVSNQSTNSSEIEANKIYQDMKNKSKDIEESWRVYYLLISLPTKFLFTPFLREIKKANLDNFISGKITEKQFSTRWILRDYLANLLNSFSLGILFYLILRILKHYRKQT